MALQALFIVGVFACVFLNLLVVVVLLKKGRELNYMDLLMVSLAVSDLFQSAIGYSVEIYSFYTEEMISDMRCKVAGFSTTFLGLVSISHLVGIAVERYVILKYPIRARTWSEKPSVALYVVIPAWLYGLGWAILPLLGWSAYAREDGDQHRCGIDLTTRAKSYIAYSYNLLVWCFIVPVLVIGFCCYSIYGALKLMRSQGEALGVADKIVEMRKQMQRRQSIMSLVLIGTFILAWFPYAVCVFVLTAKGSVSHSLLSFASVFAKMSTLYNPIIYSVFMKDFRDRCKKLFGCRVESGLAHFNSETCVTRTGSSNVLGETGPITSKSTTGATAGATA